VPVDHARPPGSPSNSSKLFTPPIVTFSPTQRPHKSFIRNTYRPPRKCCKQKTYIKSKSFRCNTYKKHGGPRLLRLFNFSIFQLFNDFPPRVFNCLRTLPSYVSCKSFACHSYETAGCIPTIPILELSLLRSTLNVASTLRPSDVPTVPSPVPNRTDDSTPLHVHPLCAMLRFPRWRSS
jgi:hypothetical protein